VFLSLIGVEGTVKPFECVGTKEEAKASVYLAWQIYRQLDGYHPEQQSYTVPCVLETLINHVREELHASGTKLSTDPGDLDGPIPDGSSVMAFYGLV
jgi:hypothetical protein